MKFLILLAIIGFVAVSAFPTQEELIKKATELEASLDTDIKKVRSAHPTEARNLEDQKQQLKALARELATAKNDVAVLNLAARLNAVEKNIEKTLRKIDARTVRPVKTTEAPVQTTSA